MSSYGLVAHELERVDSGHRSMKSVPSILVMYRIYVYGTQEQCRKYLPKLASGAFIGCFETTESDTASDSAATKIVAKKTDGGYVLNGSTMWISNSPIADVFVVLAKSEAHGGKITDFVMDKATRGLTAPKIDDKLSLSTSITGEIVMNNSGAGEDALLPRVAELKSLFDCLNRAHYGIFWGTIGAAEACIHVARQCGLDQHQFDRSFAQTQLFALKLGNMQTEIALGLQAALRVGLLMDEVRLPPRWSA